MRNISVIEWFPTADRKEYAGSVICSVVTDTQWNIAITGTVPGDQGSRQIVPKFVLVDNQTNNAACSIAIGPFNWSIPAFTREIYALQIPTQSVRLTLSVGAVQLVFAENKEFLTASSDQVAIQQAAAQFVTYSWLTKTGGGPQLSTDQNKMITLTAATAQNYSLQSIAGANIPNGWYNPTIECIGAGTWSLVPNGADQINGLYTAANPLPLATGSKIDFSCDATQWKAKGTLVFDSGNIPIVAGGAVNLNHNFMGPPDEILLSVINTNPEAGYVAGDELLVPALDDNTVYNEGLRVLRSNIALPNQLQCRFVNNPNIFAIPQKATTARSALTNANWDFRVRLLKHI